MTLAYASSTRWVPDPRNSEPLCRSPESPPTVFDRLFRRDTQPQKPQSKATIWRVLRHKANQIQRLFLRRLTKLQTSSNSNTSPTWYGSKVASSRGRFVTFFEPRSDGLTRYSEYPRQTAKGSPLVVSAQNLLFAFLAVAIRLRRFTQSPFAIAAPITLLAVTGLTPFVHSLTAAMITSHSLECIPLSHYLIFN